MHSKICTSTFQESSSLFVTIHSFYTSGKRHDGNDRAYQIMSGTDPSRNVLEESSKFASHPPKPNTTTIGCFYTRHFRKHKQRGCGSTNCCSGI